MAEEIMYGPGAGGAGADPNEQIAKEAIEATAKKIGWNPEFDGEGALDAEAYIIKGREMMDTQRKAKRSQDFAHKRDLDAIKADVARLNAANKQFYESNAAAAKAEIEALKQERRVAISDADADEVDAIDAKIDAVAERAKAPQIEQPQPAGNDPDFEEWHGENEWYLTDKERTDYANELNKKFLADPEISALPYPRFLKKIEKAVKAEFDKKDPPPTPSGVEGAGTKVRSGGSKMPSIKDLPQDIQESARRQVRLGIYPSGKEFIKANPGLWDL